jgi:iron(II)-dependent oxidoreductase
MMLIKQIVQFRDANRGDGSERENEGDHERTRRRARRRDEVASLRRFLVDHFSREELELFCSDYFREVYLDHEGSSLSKSFWAHRLVEYCQRRGILADLHAALKKERATPYSRHLAPALSQEVADAPAVNRSIATQRPRRLRSAITLHAPIHLELLRVRAGWFWMGSHVKKDDQAQTNELLRHRVFLSDYYIARHPITNEQFAIFAQITQRNFKVPRDKDKHPVVQVSWHDAAAFCDWLSQSTNRRFGLPTEAEWEKAARGADGRIYPWGDRFDSRKLNSFEIGVHDTTPVGQYSPHGDSPCGAADMSGNVWEWCADWFDEEEYQRRRKTRVIDPQGPAQGIYRVVRGGAFDFTKGAVRCAYRAGNPPHLDSYDYGFRVVMRP